MIWCEFTSSFADIYCALLFFLSKEQRNVRCYFSLNLPLISQSRWLTIEEIPFKPKPVSVRRICPSRKCQCSSDWMHVDRDNCGAACCQGRGRETQWPRLVTHLQQPPACWLKPSHFRPGSNSLISYSRSAVSQPVHFFLLTSLHLRFPNISVNNCGNAANPSLPGLREKKGNNDVCRRVTRTWTKIDIRSSDAYLLEFYQQKLQYCCCEVLLSMNKSNYLWL